MLANLFFLIASFTGIVFFTRMPDTGWKDLVPKLTPPENLKYFTFGYDESMADSLWIRVIQNIDFCEAGKQRPPTPEQEKKQAEKTPVGDIFAEIEANRTQPRCELGWVYQMLDRITDLSPRFLMAYTMGATTLSVVVDDPLGASRLYDKGLKQFPHNWSLAYRAAYHALYEMKDFKKAADLLYLAGQNGAPLWVQSLASRLYERTGQLLLGRMVLIDLLKRSQGDPALEEKAMERLKHLDSLWNKENSKNP